MDLFKQNLAILSVIRLRHSRRQYPSGEAIQNPHVHYTKSLGAWCATTYYNLWSANTAKTEINDDAVVKTIYDPSPAGYHLPASRAFTGFTYDGRNIYGNGFMSTYYNSPYTSSADIANKFGWEFYCNKMTGKGSYDTSGGTIFFSSFGLSQGYWCRNWNRYFRRLLVGRVFYSGVRF